MQKTRMLGAVAAMILGFASSGYCGILFQENFEDSNLSSRGWYDNTTPILSSTEHIANSTKSLQMHFAQGGVTPDNGTTMRKKFTATDSVYVSYYIKHTSNWVGSNQTFQPHEFYLLNSMEGDWSGLIPTHMTAYIEENAGQSVFAFQDSLNIDLANINKNLVGTTEKRGVAGCNGDSDGYGNGDCYANGSIYWNGKQYKSSGQVFSSSTGPYYKGDWHFVETYFKLNSVVNGVGVKDGILQQWYDGQLIMNYNNVVFRTGANPTMTFNQFIIGPYIGAGSPVDQSFWIDNLTVATAPPSQTGVPAAPQNLKIN